LDFAVTFGCERCGVDVEVAVRRAHRYCEDCKVEARREGKARSDRKNSERVRAAGKRWRAENVERYREQERRRSPRPSRAEYQRRWWWNRRLDQIAREAAPKWAIAAQEVNRAWLALPAGPSAEEKTGPCCPVACATSRRFTAGHCLECDAAFVVSPDRGDRYCSPICGKRYDRRLRRARQVAGFVERVSSRKVYERDGWRCQLCKRLVSKTAVVPHPRSATIDHIVPLAAGGEHSMANAQTAHFICNSEKGAQARDEQLRLVG
jgi:5-methylcytosine-specific restriction endonuclease McrA